MKRTKTLFQQPSHITLTMKMLLHCKNNADASALDNTANAFTKACNYISKRYWENNCHNFTHSVHHNLYYSVRNLFGLKAQQAGTVFRTVKAKYHTVATQLYLQVQRYKDKYSNHTFYINRKPVDLWHPIKFHTPQLKLQRKNDWSFSHDKSHKHMMVSINTLHKRKKFMYYVPKYFRQYMQAPWKYGVATYLKRGTKRYLFISVKRKLKKLTIDDIKKLAGHDRGQRHLVFSYGSHNIIFHKRGLSCRKKRSHFLKLRARLQSRQTRSAKRKLQRMSGRENCWMATVNHRASKALVQRYGSRTAHGLENLRGVKFEAMNSPLKNRYARATWTFYEFGHDMMYKSLLENSVVIHVNPQNTSRRDPFTGYVNGDNRHHSIHTYYSYKKHTNYKRYRYNDDLIAGMNIKFLVKLQLLGYDRPFIKSDNQIGYHIKCRRHGKLVHIIRYLSRRDALKLDADNVHIN